MLHPDGEVRIFPIRVQHVLIRRRRRAKLNGIRRPAGGLATQVGNDVVHALLAEKLAVAAHGRAIPAVLQGVLQERVGGVGQQGLIADGRRINALPLVAVAVGAQRTVALGARLRVAFHRIAGELQGLNAFDLQKPAGEDIHLPSGQGPAHLLAVGRHRRTAPTIADGRSQMRRKARAEELRALQRWGVVCSVAAAIFAVAKRTVLFIETRGLGHLRLI